VATSSRDIDSGLVVRDRIDVRTNERSDTGLARGTQRVTEVDLLVDRAWSVNGELAIALN
jgi:hypothetical protein